jgi:sulfate/thiosulfate transport system substrate-binding protein
MEDIQMHSYRLRLAVAVLVTLLSLGGAVAALHSISEGSNSDPTSKMFEDLNAAFERHWRARTGVDVTVKPAKTASGVPVRVFVDGLKVVALSVSYDAEALQASTRFTLPHWQNLLPHDTPFTSTIVFLVRKGNPKNLQDWSDLVRPGVEVAMANPKISDGARWSYMAAWGYALKRFGGSESQAHEFVRNLLANANVVNADTHESISSFVTRDAGDVLLAWEYEAHQIIHAKGGDKFEVVVPSISILAEPPISVVNGMPEKTGARRVAKAYIDYLYSTKAQDIAGRHYYRPRDEKMAAKYAEQFPPIGLYTIDEIAGGWKAAQATHFDDGGILDQIQRDSNP